ncbi:copper chaperone PCu(A)C [Thauera sp. WH-2]|jgi:hypothetical protein|uniref:copper chaperone PCu(A)C n=2 Tax=Thauera TaxID=33057 RepID=UPI003AAC5B6D
MMRKPLTAALLLAASLSVSAQQLTVTEPWVRATVPQQKATGAFMHLRSDADVRLVAAESPVAGVVEIHEMSMQNDVMKMSPISGLDLPAGQDVELKPGGYHVMLMDLRQQVKVGDEVPLRLVIERRDGSRESVDVVAPARPLNARMQMKH